MAALLSRYNKMLVHHPRRTNFLTAGALGFLGDVICQMVVEGQDKMDWKRCFAMSTFGCCYGGTVSYQIYTLYPRVLPKWFLAAPLRTGLGSSALDNFIHVPFLYTPVFYLWTEVAQGRTWDETYDTLVKCAMPSIHACWVMWIPYQTINFGFVPAHRQCVFMNAGCLLWNIILDYIANNTPDQAKEVIQVPVPALPEKDKFWASDAQRTGFKGDIDPFK